ncbi:MAG: nitroreductase [Deltaproteobacteria bacterium]|nr:nitroreductase [bacterium]MCB9488783.1 nitroreductase [Deltaproteobacteria bacterium]
MDVQEALLTRRTVHMYEDQPVDETAVDRAVAAAHGAPNHKLSFPWRFVRVGKQTRAKLLENILKDMEDAGKLNDAKAKLTTEKIMNPAFLVCVSQIRSDDDFRSKEDYAACACAIQNFMLSLHGEGIASKWGTGDPTRDPRTYELFGIDPSVEEIIGFVWVGVPKMVPSPKRPEIETVYRTLP